MKTIHKWDWVNGYTIERHLSRSFNTLEEAQRFAENKQVIDIYRTKGCYKVEWVKVIDMNTDETRIR